MTTRQQRSPFWQLAWEKHCLRSPKKPIDALHETIWVHLGKGCLTENTVLYAITVCITLLFLSIPFSHFRLERSRWVEGKADKAATKSPPSLCVTSDLVRWRWIRKKKVLKKKLHFCVTQNVTRLFFKFYKKCTFWLKMSSMSQHVTWKMYNGMGFLKALQNIFLLNEVIYY